jgi:hypothetical protein
VSETIRSGITGDGTPAVPRTRVLKMKKAAIRFFPDDVRFTLER